MSEIVEVFAYWQERCNHPQAKLTNDRRARVKARLNEDYTVAEIKRGIDGAAEHPFVDPVTGTVFDDLELICRNGSKLENFIARAELPPPSMRPAALDRADAYLDAPEYRGRR
jgi:hypothetical protein